MSLKKNCDSIHPKVCYETVKLYAINPKVDNHMEILFKTHLPPPRSAHPPSPSSSILPYSPLTSHPSPSTPHHIHPHHIHLSQSISHPSSPYPPHSPSTCHPFRRHPPLITKLPLLSPSTLTTHLTPPSLAIHPLSPTPHSPTLTPFLIIHTSPS